MSFSFVTLMEHDLWYIKLEGILQGPQLLFFLSSRETWVTFFVFPS